MLLACLRRASGPVTVPQLLALLDINGSGEAALRHQLEWLERSGVLFSQRRGRWAMHSRARVVVGRVSCPRPDYGFVAPEDGSRRDLFVSKWKLHGARHGDLVLARVVGPARGNGGGSGSTQGEVVAVLERRPPFLAGLFRGDAAGGIVIPRDERASGPVSIDRPGPGARDGALVWAEVTAPEDRSRPARGRLVEVLGRPEEPGVIEAAIERIYDLPAAFSVAVEEEAAAASSTVRSEDRRHREDFTRALAVTIDPEDARDHDDAVGLERLVTARGAHFRLAVHIADVARYVRPGSALDGEALRRGVSVYLPGRVIPMLPPALSSGLCSLLPGEERLVQTVVMDFDERGARAGYRFTDGILRSRARLTYTQAAAALGGAPEVVSPETAEMLDEMRELSARLRARRLSRGGLDLDLPEAEIRIDTRGRPVEARRAVRTVAHEIIEEFMLAANETVAENLREKAGATLYRIHEEPDPSRIDEVEGALVEMGYAVPRGPRRAADRIRALLGMFRGRPEEHAIAVMILRSLKLARYSHEPIGHFGLSAPWYTHFTSPIRRYPDLVVHRILRGVRSGLAQDDADAPRLEAVALQCSRLERRAEEAERAALQWMQAQYMSGRVGEEMHGQVTGLSRAALFVTLGELGVEGVVPLAAGAGGAPRTARGRGRAEAKQASNRGARWGLGETLRVRVQSVDTLRARVLLRPVSTG